MPKQQQANSPLSKPKLGPATSLVAYVLGAGALGWGVDRALNTLPWGMVTGVLLGFVAWIYVATQAERG